MVQRRDEFGRKVNAHNATHLAAVDGYQYEGLLGHEAEHGRQRGDQA